MVVFCGKPLIQALQMRPSKDLEKTNSCRHILKRSSNTFEVEAHNSLKPPLEHNQEQIPSTNQGCV